MFKALFANLQKVGKSLMLPVSVLPVAGILLGVGAANFSFLPEIVSQLMKNAGDSVFGQMPLLFAVGVALGFTKNDGVAALAAIVGYGIMQSVLSMLGNMELSSVQEAAAAAGNVLSDLDMKGVTDKYQTGVLGGVLAGSLAAWAFNRYYRIQLPDYLGFFAGKRAVPIITGILAIVLGVILSVIWPPIASVIGAFSHWAA